jgi:hypothetical protein
MRRLLFVVILFLLLPVQAEAKSTRVYEKWLFRTAEDIDAWKAVNLDEAKLMSEGLEFDVNEKAVFFRALPEGFHKNVDAIKMQYDGTGLDEIAIIVIRTNEEGDIENRFRLVKIPQDGIDDLYIPLAFYRPDIEGADVFAVSFSGTAKDVTFDGVRFLHYSPLDKLYGAWKSFWIFEPFNAHTINILLGPTITSDIGPINTYVNWKLLSLAVNAPIMLGLTLFGIALLFWGVWHVQSLGRDWRDVIRVILRRFLLVTLAVWVLYDFRMGWEFVNAVARDHVNYISADSAERTFRDRGRFYDFAKFTKELVKDREYYEVFLPDQWPYFGNMRYETYPSLPNADEPVSDTWVIYNRPDIWVNDDRKLVLGDMPFSNPGEVIGRFDEWSYIFRETSEEEA